MASSSSSGPNGEASSPLETHRARTAATRHAMIAAVAKGKPRRRDARQPVEVEGRGRVKFFNPDKGWGGIVSPDVPADVWVSFGVIDAPGYRTLDEGDEVEFRCVKQQQDSWQYVATWVMRTHAR